MRMNELERTTNRNRTLPLRRMRADLFKLYRE
jgi:hypothetical protein